MLAPISGRRAATAALLSLLAGCSTGRSTPSPPPAVPVEPPSFVAAVQRQLPQVAVDRREEELAAIAEQVCASLADGKDRPAVLDEIRDAGFGAGDARTLLALAEETACRP